MPGQELGKPLPFDVDKEFVEVLSSVDGPEAFIAGSRMHIGPDKEIRAATFHYEDYGKGMARAVVREGRAMLEKVNKLGVGFPLQPQRFVELALLGARPKDEWSVTESSPSRFSIQISKCSLLEMLPKAGLERPDFLCKVSCLALFGQAARNSGVQMKTEITKTIPKDGICEFVCTFA